MSHLETLGQFQLAVKLARGIRAFRQVLTDKVMAEFMDLQGSPLGFETDRDKQGGYPVEVVREVLIEGFMRGARPVMNEINIIAGGCYLAQAYWRRMVREFDGIDKIDERWQVPEMKQGGALVGCTITYTIDGIKQEYVRRLYKRKLADGEIEEIDERVPVRVNQGMGVDAILGKAARKVFKAIYERLTNVRIVTRDDDEVVIEGKLVEPEQQKQLEADKPPATAPDRQPGSDDPDDPPPGLLPSPLQDFYDQGIDQLREARTLREVDAAYSAVATNQTWKSLPQAKRDSFEAFRQQCKAALRERPVGRAT